MLSFDLRKEGVIIEAKKYLQQIKILDTKIKYKEEQYREVYEAAINISAIRYDKERVTGGKQYDRTINLISEYLLLEKQILDQKMEFQKVKNSIIDEIYKLSDDKYITVLYKRYVEYKSFREIAIEMKYSPDYVKELHRKALNKISH